MHSAMTSGRNGCRVHLHFGRLCALVVIVLGLHSAQAPGQCLEQKLDPSGRTEDDRFGVSVSVSGDTAVVGAHLDDCDAGVGCGSAYVYRFDGSNWVEEAKLTASESRGGLNFGFSVSVSGDTIVVGARNDDCATGWVCGSAYVYRFDGSSWLEEAKLSASDAATGGFFGRSVSVSGDTAVVGAYGDDCAGGDNCGSAHVYRFDGSAWVEEAELTASDAAAVDYFGYSVSNSGDTAVVGSFGDDCAFGDNCGSAYVYRFDGSSWAEEAKLTASDATASGLFGSVVSVSGDTAVVGAFGDDCAALSDCGSAYVFRFNGISWVEEQKLTASDAAAGDSFGFAVSVSGDTAVVGAKHDNYWPGYGYGSAYVYRFNGSSWVEKAKLTASDAATGDFLGASVSISGDTAFVGAGGEKCPESYDCGSAYVFSCVFPTIVSLDIKPGGCPNMVNPRSRGVVPVAIVGSLDFDVATIDLDSLTLARADGVGTGVSPLAERRGPEMVGRRGPGIAIEDVATPFDGELCECHEPGGDGIDDLTLKFSTSEISSAFELNALPRGTAIELVLRGSLQDGTTFEAVDCIVIPGTPRHSPGLRSTGKPD